MKTTKIYLSLCGLIGLGLLSSCNKEDPGPNQQNYELYVKDRDQYPSWSPDGTHIAYCHLNVDTNEPNSYPSGLYIIDNEGNNRQLLQEGSYLSPTWSPDGKWITVTSAGNLISINVDTGEQNMLSSDIDDYFFPDYSSDGINLIFDRLVNENGSLLIGDVNFESSPTVFLESLLTARDCEFSLDGQSLLYMKGGEWDFWEIFKYDLQSELETRLTNNNLDDRAPTWSPDNSNIAWSSNLQITVMTSDGLNPKIISIGQFPSWSINNRIIFSGPDADITKEVLYVIDPDGSNKTQITF